MTDAIIKPDVLEKRLEPQGHCRLKRPQVMSIPLGRLSPEAIADHTKSLLPYPNEFAGMIDWLRDSKGWSPAYIASLVGCSPSMMIQIHRKVMPKKPFPVPVLRMLWMLYQLDVCPQCLVDPFHIATWGKVNMRLPVQLKFTKPQQEKITEVLKTLKRTDKFVQTIGAIARQVNARLAGDNMHIDEKRLLMLCNRLGFKLAKKHKRNVMPPILDPHGIWMNVDWRKDDKAIAQEFRHDVMFVKRARKKLASFSKQKLGHYLRTTGRNPDHFEPFLEVTNPPTPPTTSSASPVT